MQLKRTTKSLWVYTAILIVIAIALIFATTILQARLISSDGNIEVLGTFTRDAKQNIATLTDENVKLTNKLNELSAQKASLENDYNELMKSYQSETGKKEIVKNMYIALENNDYAALSPLMSKISKEDADAFLPGLYADAQRALKNNEEN